MVSSAVPLHKSFSRKLFVPLLIAGLLLTLVVSISLLSADDYPVRATFRYSVFVTPEWLNTTSYNPGSTYGRGFIFWYGWSYEIVEEELAAVNAPLLQVTSQSLAYNLSDVEAFSRGMGLAFYYPWNNIRGSYTIADASDNSSTTSLFDESFFGPELPYFAHLPYSWAGCGYYVNFDDLISQHNVTDGNVEIRWALWLNDIKATVDARGENLLPAYIGSVSRSLLDINVTVRQGVPEEIQYSNSSISTTQKVGLTRSNVTVDSPIYLYNPRLLSLKQSVSPLAGASLLLIVVQAAILYRERPRAAAPSSEEADAENP